MTDLWERITRVSATTWFAIAVLLTIAGYIGGESVLWSLFWFVPHMAILFGVWRGSQSAWAVLVCISLALATALTYVGIGVLFSSGSFMHIYWWGPTAHGAALFCLVAFRASRRRAIPVHLNMNGYGTRPQPSPAHWH